jgi:alpha-mannosidase
MSSPISGMGAVFYARADYQDQAARKQNKSTEFFWYPSPSLGRAGGTLGGILADYYYPPAGLNFGGDDNTEPVMDDPTLEGYNVPQFVDLFVSTARGFQNFTRGDVMMLMGTDFSVRS